MASVDFQKNTFTGGAAMVGHMTRHDGQAVEYRNKYIDPERAGDNYIIGAKRFEDTTARGVMDRLRERVRAVDEVQPPKRRVKDRVTVMTYTIAAPDGLSEKQEREFFRVAYDELARFSGGRENVSPGYVHRDEIHDYVDAASGERKTSRAHMHVAGIPYTAEKGVNGKAFETRARMRELNKTIDERCRRELGFKFLTGERGLSGRSVEEMQAASETRTKKQERARINAELADKRQEVRDLSGEVGDLERTRDALSAQNARISDLAAEKVKQAEQAEKDAQEAAERAQEAEERAKQARQQVEQQAQALERLADIDMTTRKKLGGREVVEVSPEDANLFRNAAANYRKAVAIINERDNIIDDAKVQVDRILRQADIGIRFYKEQAEKQAAEYKRTLEQSKRTGISARTRVRSRGDDGPGGRD